MALFAVSFSKNNYIIYEKENYAWAIRRQSRSSMTTHCKSSFTISRVLLYSFLLLDLCIVCNTRPRHTVCVRMGTLYVKPTDHRSAIMAAWLASQLPVASSRSSRSIAVNYNKTHLEINSHMSENHRLYFGVALCASKFPVLQIQDTR